MEDETLIIHIRDLLLKVESSQESVEEGYKKFQVALTGALRLLDGNSQMLERLHGSPEDLKGFLLNLSTELEKDTIGHWEAIKSEIEAILRKIKPGDRKF